MLSIFAHSFMTATRTDAPRHRDADAMEAKATPRRKRLPLSLWYEGRETGKEGAS